MSQRFDRAVTLVARWEPVRSIAELGPERLLINFACALIGLGGLIEPAEPGSLLAQWPRWFAYEWSAAMLVGGLSALWGIVAGGRVREWVGYVCIGAAASVYGVAIILTEHSLASARIGGLFLAIAVAKAIRLLVNYGARAALLHQAQQQDGPPGERPAP